MSSVCEFFWVDGKKAWGCVLEPGHIGPHQQYASGMPVRPVKAEMESDFTQFQRIRLKHINEMLGQLNQDATGIHLLMVERDSIKEFLGE